MENKRRALGKGLEQLFGSENVDIDAFEQNIVDNANNNNEIKQINLSEIRSNPYQPRTYFNEDALNELAESIKIHGVVEPIIVKKSIKGYELVAGERRTKASRIAGLETIPAVVKDFTDQEMMDIAILENIQREDLSPLELAEGFKKYIEATGMSQDEVAKKFGKSRSYITNALGLLNLPTPVKEKINNKEISASHARVLSKFDDENVINELADKVAKEKISVRELELISSTDESIPKRKPITRQSIKINKYGVYENALKEKLGLRVSVLDSKIVIPFNTEEDLNRIFELLNIDLDEN